MYPGDMGAHLDVLLELYEALPDDCRRQMAYFGSALYSVPRFDAVKEIEVKPDDDPLVALRKVEMQHSVPMKDLPGYEEPEMNRVVARIEELSGLGLREGFLVTCLLDEVDKSIKGLADPEASEKSLEFIRRLTDHIRQEMEADSVENANEYQEMIAHYERTIETRPEQLDKYRSLYHEWRAVVGTWIDKDRILGCWPEFMGE